MTEPLISVLLPVYNGAKYLEEAVVGILAQTYQHFEIIIINDGSTDYSAAVIQKYHDPRISYYEQANQGLAATLNRAVSLAQGEFLARQDQDDVSLPLRFERQVAFLQAHSDCGMVGTWADIWIENTKTERCHRHPAENEILQFDLLFNNPFVHSSVMLRKEVFERLGGYCTDKSRQPPEDYELWSRVARQFEVANIPEVLLVYREVPKSMSRDSLNPFLDRLVKITHENVSLLFDGSLSDKKITRLAEFIHGAYNHLGEYPDFNEMHTLLIAAADRMSDRYALPQETLRGRARLCFALGKAHFLSTHYCKLWALVVLAWDRIRRLRP